MESFVGAQESTLDAMQLAPGTTRGSRHILEGEADVFRRWSGDPLVGPVVHVRERAVLTHPEHADVSLPPGWYELRYQREYEDLDLPEKFRWTSRRALD